MTRTLLKAISGRQLLIPQQRYSQSYLFHVFSFIPICVTARMYTVRVCLLGCVLCSLISGYACGVGCPLFLFIVCLLSVCLSGMGRKGVPEWTLDLSTSFPTSK